jgi:hypothetical protein
MDHDGIYTQLFKAVEAECGPMDDGAMHAIIGFPLGGPLCFHTVGARSGGKFVTYVSCELATYSEQHPAGVGRFELMATCNDEKWVRQNLTAIGNLSLESRLDDQHTIDMGQVVDPGESLQGVFLEAFCSMKVARKKVGILRCVGITRDEMEFAQKVGVSKLTQRLKKAGVYPNTDTGRASVIKS